MLRSGSETIQQRPNQKYYAEIAQNVDANHKYFKGNHVAVTDASSSPRTSKKITGQEPTALASCTLASASPSSTRAHLQVVIFLYQNLPVGEKIVPSDNCLSRHTTKQASSARDTYTTLSAIEGTWWPKTSDLLVPEPPPFTCFFICYSLHQSRVSAADTTQCQQHKTDAREVDELDPRGLEKGICSNMRTPITPIANIGLSLLTNPDSSFSTKK